MEHITRTIRLTGARKGETLEFQKHRFQNGLLTLRGTPADVDRMTHYMEVYLQTEVVNDGEPHPEAAAASGPIPPVGGHVEPVGAGPASLPTEDGGGHDSDDAGEPGVPASGDGSQSARLLEALNLLDTLDNSHWTTTGLPMVSAVSEILGEAVTRSDIEAVAPHFRREV